MLFGERLALARKDKGFSKEKLAKRLGVHAPIIGWYEREEVKPSIEVAARIAESPEVSLDYLSGITEHELNQDIIKEVNNLQSLSPEERSPILKKLQSLVRDAKVRAAYG